MKKSFSYRVPSGNQVRSRKLNRERIRSLGICGCTQRSVDEDLQGVRGVRTRQVFSRIVEGGLDDNVKTRGHVGTVRTGR